ncbi:MAG TPA: hypothetical protein VN238_04710, partial [Solirubrobacteraceae bacterium]|nr:hypothetical protein [Solirubrobacteraceae bacterium]
MKVLFVMRTAGFVRNFEAVLRELLRRGHDVHVAIERPQDTKPAHAAALEALHEAGQLTVVEGAEYRGEMVHRVATQVRAGLDYLRYLAPVYADKPKLRERAASRTPAL